MSEPLAAFATFPLSPLNTKEWRHAIALSQQGAIAQSEAAAQQVKRMCGVAHRAVTCSEQLRIHQLGDLFQAGSLADAVRSLEYELADADAWPVCKLVAALHVATLHADFKTAALHLKSPVKLVFDAFDSLPLFACGVAVAPGDLFRAIDKSFPNPPATVMEKGVYDTYLDVGCSLVMGVLPLWLPRLADPADLLVVESFVAALRGRIAQIGDVRQAHQYLVLCSETMAMHLLWHGVASGSVEMLDRAEQEARFADDVGGFASYINDVVSFYLALFLAADGTRRVDGRGSALASLLFEQAKLMPMDPSTVERGKLKEMQSKHFALLRTADSHPLKALFKWEWLYLSESVKSVSESSLEELRRETMQAVRVAATVSLDSVAERANWCIVWRDYQDRLANMFHAAGVKPESRTMAKLVKELEQAAVEQAARDRLPSGWSWGGDEA